MTSLPLVFEAPRRGLPPRHLADLDEAQRRQAVVDLGWPAYRADQLSRHYFARLENDPAAMTELPAAAREALAALLPPLLTEVRHVETDSGTTRKTLWRLHDGVLVESVLMHYPARADSKARTTVCVSSQAGCGMACPFCATGQGGLTRNLSTAEIVEQVRLAAVAAAGNGGRLSNVVFMGMGEPLANYARLQAALHRLIDPAPGGLGLSQRSITVSTVGLAPAIERLAGEGLNVTLAVSLHAPDDELRDTLVPVNNRWKVAEVLAAADGYAARTGRRYSIEYAMIRNVNDQAWRADLLGELLSTRLAHVNLIPLNPTPGSQWDASPKPVEREFVRRLQDHGVAVTVRDTRGREIDGACGQLAALDSAAQPSG
jgi:23S rRNA (adenine2503-C2)-methyltransferase